MFDFHEVKRLRGSWRGHGENKTNLCFVYLEIIYHLHADSLVLREPFTVSLWICVHFILNSLYPDWFHKVLREKTLKDWCHRGGRCPATSLGGRGAMRWTTLTSLGQNKLLERKAALDGELTLESSTLAVSQMASGRAPGVYGLPSDHFLAVLKYHRPD